MQRHRQRVPPKAVSYNESMSASTNQIAGARSPLADCHTHLDQYDSAELPQILQRAQEVGVGLIIAAATTLASARRILELCREHPILYAGIGLHPMDLLGPLDESTLEELRRLAQDPNVVVWSETGLDYLPTSPAKEVQQQAFRDQIQLAKELDLPLVVHSRGSDQDLLRLLREEDAGRVGGALHYFQGDMATAQAAMELGFYISLAKPLLRLPELQEVAARLPLERVLLETDSFPQPFKKYRHRWTEPCHLPQVAEKLAELQGIPVESVAEVTTSNLLRMLRGRVSREQLPAPPSGQAQ